ncbi:MFS transporter [Nocardioides psychrotolerans]|uniref:Drug resistance transporter, EmrB/QacA subfamily n=1 Tax=Nocardioides psychrotolerans TaxID=1005945 RepID=A0A1I3CLG2_9ACTN|nr:MFS transporter [Nocardioides psychrotolerans]GEP36797.1 MFS transporter [Nocardioides psychrotolerans]SFH75146.1 drug resistance transporter, EmrB/QacA subfamily [Nocardioides psychrotolerans]
MTDTQETEEQSSAKELHLGWALVLISVAQLMVVLDASIANIALPFIGNDLNIDDANLTWIVTGYALAFGGLLLLGGRLGDLYGRRRVFMIGLAVFAVASFVGGFAQNEAMLLSSRGLQGLGAALASPAALALITTTFPAGPARNRAFAVYAAMSGAGAAVGLILGGWLTGLDPILGLEGWRLTFLINVPIGLTAAFLAPRFLHESESHPGELDVPGAITGTFGLLGLVYGFSRAGEEAHGWGDTWTIASLAAGVALLAAFAFIESRVAHPLLPVRVFANRTRATSFLVMALVPAAMFAMFYFLSLFIQLVVGYSPLHTGFAFLPFSVGIVFGAGLSSTLINRIDPRFIAGTGTLMAAAALFGFSRLEVPTSTEALLAIGNGSFLGDGVNYWTSIFPFIMLMSVGMGAVFVPLTLTAVHHLRAEDSGIGSGVLNTMQQVGGALGLAILGTVSLHYADGTKTALARDLVAQGVPADAAGGLAFIGSFTEGATAAFLVGAVLISIGSAAIWLFLNVKHEELATDGPEGGAPVHVG